MRKLILFIIPAMILLSCQQKQTVELVKEVYPDGVQKQLIQYEIKGVDSIPIHEINYHRDGSLKMEGDLIDGLREGEWMSWYPDGTVWSKGYFAKGKRTGESKAYYPNSILHMSGTYEEGRKVGIWKVFDNTGKLQKKQDFSRK